MTKEKFLGSENLVLQTIGNIFTPDQLAGLNMSLTDFACPHGVWDINAAFMQRMADVGYMRAQAWSTWFIETVYTKAYLHHNQLNHRFEKIFRGSTLDTFRRMCINHGFKYVETPALGAIAFLQMGHTWIGQAGIVVKITSATEYTTLEAHNPTGEANSFCLKFKNRKTNIAHLPHGLNLQGFIIPHPSLI